MSGPMPQTYGQVPSLMAAHRRLQREPTKDNTMTDPILVSLDYIPKGDGLEPHVVITPAIARQIVAMAATEDGTAETNRDQRQDWLREINTLKACGLTQAPFMYAKADKYGKPIFDESCVSSTPEGLNDDEDDEVNILPVYTGPQVLKLAEELHNLRQHIAEQDQRIAGIEAERDQFRANLQDAIARAGDYKQNLNILKALVVNVIKSVNDKDIEAAIIAVDNLTYDMAHYILEEK